MKNIELNKNEFTIIKNNWKQLKKDRDNIIIYQILTKKDPKSAIFSSFSPEKNDKIYHYNYLLHIILNFRETSVLSILDQLLPYTLSSKKREIVQYIQGVFTDIVFTLLGELNSISKFSAKRISYFKRIAKSINSTKSKKNSLYYFLYIIFTKKDITKTLMNSFPKSKKEDKIYYSYSRSRHFTHSGLVKTILDVHGYRKDYFHVSHREMLHNRLQEKIFYWLIKNNDSKALSFIERFED